MPFRVCGELRNDPPPHTHLVRFPCQVLTGRGIICETINEVCDSCAVGMTKSSTGGILFFQATIRYVAVYGMGGARGTLSDCILSIYFSGGIYCLECSFPGRRVHDAVCYMTSVAALWNNVVLPFICFPDGRPYDVGNYIAGLHLGVVSLRLQIPLFPGGEGI